MQQRMWLGRGLIVSALLGVLVGCGAEEPVVGGGGTGADGGSPGGGYDAGGYNPYADGGGTPGGGTGGATGGGTGGSMGGVQPGGECGSIEKEAQVERGPVDIVLALDTSGSMTSHICNVSKNLSSFADAVGKGSHVIANYQIGIDLFFQFAALCQKDDPLAGTTLAMDPSRYLRVNSKVDSHNALQKLLDNYDMYKAFLRPGSPTHFIIVTDDSSQ